MFRRIGIGTTLKFPDRRIARAADGIKRDAPGNAAGASFHRGKRILGPGSWQGLDVAARCLLLSRPLRDSLPNWGRDDGRAARANRVSTDVTAIRMAKSAASTATPLSARCVKFTGRVFAAGYPDTAKLSEVMFHLNETSLSQVRRDHETDHLEHKIAHASN